MAEPTAPKPRRGWLSLYAAAFALVIVSGALVVYASLVQRLDVGGLSILRVTWWISAVSIVLAIAAVVLPRRRG